VDPYTTLLAMNDEPLKKEFEFYPLRDHFSIILTEKASMEAYN